MTNDPNGADGFQGLVDRARDGDRKAMDLVLERLRPYLVQLARRYADRGRPDESTSDLLQESCLRAWQKMPTFAGGNDDAETFAMFRAWISQIVRRRGIQSRRARSAKGRIPQDKIVRLKSPSSGVTTTRSAGNEPPAKGASPSTNARTRELSDRLRELLRKLADRQAATIVEMRFFDEFTIAEIARKLDLGYDQVRDQYRGTMQRLTWEIKGWL